MVSIGSKEQTRMEREFAYFEANQLWNNIYNTLDSESNDATMSLTQLAACENTDRNRYRNVLPFDKHRVLLRDQECDYINASLVKVPEADREYILTQGPLEETVSTFWLMIWQCRCRGIIMLNRLVESNRVKCHRYYPTPRTPDKELRLDDVNLSVKLMSIDKPHPSYLLRTFQLTNLEDQSNMTVSHFQLLDWPDFGVPECTTQFLSFLRHVRASGVLSRETGGPAVLHCSAGIGRSGTFCLVDSALKMIESGESDVDLRKMLLKMRHYREGLIQTAGQLRFAYRCLIDAANQSDDINFALTSKPESSAQKRSMEGPTDKPKRRRQAVDSLSCESDGGGDSRTLQSQL